MLRPYDAPLGESSVACLKHHPPETRSPGASRNDGKRLCQFVAGLGKDLLRIEATRSQQCSAYLRPALLRQGTQHRPEAIPPAQGEVIEVHRARRGHAVLFGQEHLSPQSSNGARHGRNDDLVQPVDDFIAGEQQNRTAFIARDEMYTSGSRPESMKLFPAVSFPRQRLVVA